MANTINITADQGSDYVFTIDVKDTNGAAKDITTYDVTGAFKKDYNTSQTHMFTTTKTNPVAGEITVQLLAETSSNVKSGRYVYDVTMESDSLDDTKRLQDGIITITPAIT
jgi:hypothetical protein